MRDKLDIVWDRMCACETFRKDVERLDRNLEDGIINEVDYKIQLDYAGYVRRTLYDNLTVEYDACTLKENPLQEVANAEA